MEGWIKYKETLALRSGPPCLTPQSATCNSIAAHQMREGSAVRSARVPRNGTVYWPGSLCVMDSESGEFINIPL